VERAIILSEGPMLEITDFWVASANTGAPANMPSDSSKLDVVEKETIARALKEHKRNISRAAEALGLTRSSLYRRMEKYGL
jgi:transcriptional regulator of acetoin/glycerol metabolism